MIDGFGVIWVWYCFMLFSKVLWLFVCVVGLEFELWFLGFGGFVFTCEYCAWLSFD